MQPAKKAKTESAVSEKKKSGKSKKSQPEPVADAPEPSKKDKKDKKKAKEQDTAADKHAASGVAVKGIYTCFGNPLIEEAENVSTYLSHLAYIVTAAVP